MRVGNVPFILLGVDAATRVQAEITNGGICQIVSLLEAPDGVAGYEAIELADVPDEVRLTLPEILGDQIFIGTAEEFNVEMVRLHKMGYCVYFVDISIGVGRPTVVAYSVKFDLCTCDDDDGCLCEWCNAREEAADEALDVELTDVPKGCVCDGDPDHPCQVCLAALNAEARAPEGCSCRGQGTCEICVVGATKHKQRANDGVCTCGAHDNIGHCSSCEAKAAATAACTCGDPTHHGGQTASEGCTCQDAGTCPFCKAELTAEAELAEDIVAEE